jgi:hypothetical protein
VHFLLLRPLLTLYQARSINGLESAWTDRCVRVSGAWPRTNGLFRAGFRRHPLKRKIKKPPKTGRVLPAPGHYQLPSLVTQSGKISTASPVPPRRDPWPNTRKLSTSWPIFSIPCVPAFLCLPTLIQPLSLYKPPPVTRSSIFVTLHIVKLN